MLCKTKVKQKCDNFQILFDKYLSSKFDASNIFQICEEDINYICWDKVYICIQSKWLLLKV